MAMITRWRDFSSLAVASLTLVALVRHSDIRSCAAAEVDYVTQIKPLLSAKCYSCHGAIKQQAELRLETRTLMLQGGDSGGVIEPGAADQSLLVERISADDDERMPPAEDGGALNTAEINLIRAWIDQGAHAPLEEIPHGPRDHCRFGRS